MAVAIYLQTWTGTARYVETWGIPQAVSDGSVGGGGRGGVNPWPGRKERNWDKWWKKEHARRLKRQKEAAERKLRGLQEKVKEKREDLQEARTLEAIQLLHRELERIQKKLDAEQAILDDLEMQEVALVYAIWRE